MIIFDVFLKRQMLHSGLGLRSPWIRPGYPGDRKLQYTFVELSKTLWVLRVSDLTYIVKLSDSEGLAT